MRPPATPIRPRLTPLPPAPPVGGAATESDHPSVTGPLQGRAMSAWILVSEVVLGSLVSGNYFDTLGIKPALGRTFLQEEDQTPGAHPVVVLSHGFWRSRFNSDPALVGPPDLDVWVRWDGAPEGDPVLDQALLAYSTDGFLIGTAMRPHEGVGQSQAHVTLATGVISHTLTFHQPAPAGDWLLLSHHSPFAGGGRSFGEASVFTADGALVASFVQDAMIRPLG